MKNLLNIFLLCSALTLPGCASFRPSFISDNSWELENNRQPLNENEDAPENEEERDLTDDIDGPLGGHFDEDGNWIPDNPSIPWTYQIPDISAGSIFDISTLEVTPTIQVELLEFDTPLPWPVRTYKLDAGVGYQRVYLYLGPRITSIFEISVGGFVGWNWDEGDLSYGVGFTLIKF